MPDTTVQFLNNEKLIRYFEKNNYVPPEMRAILMHGCNTRFFGKNKFVISPLDPSPDVYFLIKGAVRGFIRGSGEEITTWIGVEEEIIGLTLFSGSYYSEKDQYIQTIEKAEVVVLPLALLKTLMARFPEMVAVAKKILWFEYKSSEERNFLIRLSSAQKKVERLYLTHPEYFNRIPIKYLSSFIGMRIETLSRLRSRLARITTSADGIR